MFTSINSEQFSDITVCYMVKAALFPALGACHSTGDADRINGKLRDQHKRRFVFHEPQSRIFSEQSDFAYSKFRVGSACEQNGQDLTETHDIRLKRLRLRSWRRGTKEMDLILGPFAGDQLGLLSKPTLDVYEALLAENDQDLYQWVSGQADPPEKFQEIVMTLRNHCDSR